MATEITMPKLSDTMTEGQLGVWRKSVGEKIERGDIIAEVETDKATMDLESFTSGILLEQRIQTGELVPVGTVIGLIGLEDEAVPETMSARKVPSPDTSSVIPIEATAVAKPAPPITEYQSVPPVGLAAPVVRHRAAELGVDLAEITGSGPDGRILLDDLDQSAATTGVPGETPIKPPVDSAVDRLKVSDSGDIAVDPLSRMRAAITRVTTNSWRTIPHFYISVEVEMMLSERIVRDLKSEGESASLNALILAAVAASLVKYPGLNAALTDSGILKYTSVNLGFAVAVEGGLVVPVIKNAESKGVRVLSEEAGRLSAKSRLGNISESEISGGTFSVSNLGMHKIDSFASIIMPSQSGILAVGTVSDRPVVRNGNLEVGRVMTATLSCDHRIIDGAYAAAFLNELKRLLENPSELPA